MSKDVNTPVQEASFSGERYKPMIQMVKIRFPDDKSRVQGFYELIQRIRVICLPDDEFIIPEAGLTILDESGIPCTILEQGGFDHALKALRDSAATPV